jgi:hypothetical protein
VSLVSALREPDNVISVFLREQLPHREEVLHRWERELESCRRRQRTASGNSDQLLGRAIELRVGLDLACEPVYTDLVLALPDGEAEPLWAAIGLTADVAGRYRRLSDRVRTLHQGNAESEILALHQCLRLARVEDIQHQFGRRSELNDPKLRWLFDHLNGMAIEPANTNALISLWEVYLKYGRAELLQLGQPVTIRPRFADGFAVGDLIAGRTLIDVKLAADTTGKLPSWLDQVVGYALCDTPDQHQLEAVGIYHAREGFLKTWQLTDLLNLMSGRPIALHEVRRGFEVPLREEQATIARRQAVG